MEFKVEKDPLKTYPVKIIFFSISLWFWESNKGSSNKKELNQDRSEIFGGTWKKSKMEDETSQKFTDPPPSSE